MPKKSEPFDFKYWTEELRLANEYRKAVGYFTSWPDYERTYRNRFKKGKLPYNITYAMAQVVVPSVYGVNPYINVTPVHPMYAIASRLFETIDNYLLLLNETEDNCQTIALDTFLYGVGINEVGFMPPGPEDDKQMEDALKRAGKGILDDVYDLTKSPGMPWEDRAKPKDFLVAFGTRSISKARWAARLVTRFTEDIRNDSRFKKSEISITSVPIHGGETEITPEMADKTQIQFTSYWAVRCARTKMIYYLPVFDKLTGLPKGEKFIREPEEDKAQVAGLPFATATNNNDPDFFWATPDAAILEPFCVEMTEMRTQAREHRRKALLKIAVLYDALTEDSKIAIKSKNPEVAQLLYVTGVDDVRKAFYQFVPHIPSQEYDVFFKNLRTDLMEIFGASRNTMGTLEGGRRTLGEVELTAAHQFLRFDEKRKAMSKMLTHMFRKKNALVSRYWSQEQILPVLGFDGLVHWVEFMPKDLKGQFMIKIDPESLTPMTRRAKKQETMELLQLLAAFAKGGMPVNIAPVMTELVRQTSWFDAMQLLPQAQGEQGQSLGQFQQQQQGVLEQTGSNRIKQMGMKNAG